MRKTKSTASAAGQSTSLRKMGASGGGDTSAASSPPSNFKTAHLPNQESTGVLHSRADMELLDGSAVLFVPPVCSDPFHSTSSEYPAPSLLFTPPRPFRTSMSPSSLDPVSEYLITPARCQRHMSPVDCCDPRAGSSRSTTTEPHPHPHSHSHLGVRSWAPECITYSAHRLPAPTQSADSLDCCDLFESLQGQLHDASDDASLTMHTGNPEPEVSSSRLIEDTIRQICDLLHEKLAEIAVISVFLLLPVEAPSHSVRTAQDLCAYLAARPQLQFEIAAAFAADYFEAASSETDRKGRLEAKLLETAQAWMSALHSVHVEDREFQQLMDSALRMLADSVGHIPVLQPQDEPRANNGALPAMQAANSLEDHLFMCPQGLALKRTVMGKILCSREVLRVEIDDYRRSVRKERTGSESADISNSCPSNPHDESKDQWNQALAHVGGRSSPSEVACDVTRLLEDWMFSFDHIADPGKHYRYSGFVSSAQLQFCPLVILVIILVITDISFSAFHVQRCISE
eukprot:ANDGO_08109.mRNA.1 hypothetical protein